MSEIILENITKAYDSKTNVVEKLNLTIPDKGFTVLVGPSGCGKSTILRMIAGLEPITAGRLYFDKKVMNNISPQKRNIAMVFQNYALYPTMTVKENIEFGLINRKVEKAERTIRIKEVAETVGLGDFLRRYPSELSGGQRQRVAVARAMVKKPDVFLMDEPLSNLDARLRNQMRTELIDLHNKLDATFIYVTHDQVEAMSMASKIVLINNGVIQQESSPENIYSQPKNIFTAQFIGVPAMNILNCDSFSGDRVFPQDASYMGFRPSKVKLEKNQKGDLCFHGTIVTHEYFGSEIVYRLKTNQGVIAFKTFLTQIIPMNKEVSIYVEESDCHFFDREKNRINNCG
ncbi:ABC transporter ATP-binding protein [Pectinatus sottacetonis]|uniref:ABC transporter ATP-binding protein n=1 Tax=Pectinatus sottacetonis TaxID=1002795 RepID=UPI0018C72E8E|nr:ABC transporter ATP-binding protein [Pectinatus sottacetonis]